MSVTHINRKGKTYHLHIGKTKTGKDKYYFSLKSSGTLAETIPIGYEIYENPNAQVFLRIIQPKLITDIEKAIVEKGMKEYSTIKDHLIDIKKDTITIHTSDQDSDELSGILQSLARFHPPKVPIDRILNETLTFTPMLRFILTDEESREFTAERFCFKGRIDDWITIGGPDSLKNLIKRFVKHLGQESFFELPFII